MDWENLLRELVTAIQSQNHTGFSFDLQDGSDTCVAGCTARGNFVISAFKDHALDCPFRLAVDALTTINLNHAKS